MKKDLVSALVAATDAPGTGLANATLIIEKIDDTEYRVRKAKVIAEKDLRFPEEDLPLKLSARDARKFLAALEQPPEPSKVMRRAAKRHLNKDE